MNGNLLALIAPFGPVNSNGHSVAVGDVDGDGIKDVIAGAYNGDARVRVLSYLGVPRTGDDFFAYEPNVGVIVAAANLDGVAGDEIITGSLKKTQVKIWNNNKQCIKSFNAFNQETYHGVSVSAGNIDTNPDIELITAELFKQFPRIRVW